jgi:hypothetical protein
MAGTAISFAHPSTEQAGRAPPVKNFHVVKGHRILLEKSTREHFIISELWISLINEQGLFDRIRSLSLSLRSFLDCSNQSRHLDRCGSIDPPP